MQGSHTTHQPTTVSREDLAPEQIELVLYISDSASYQTSSQLGNSMDA
jgi:hypothetical protein